MTPHRIVSVRALDDAQRCGAAEFARIAIDAYYATLPGALARDLIAAAFLIEGDELANAVVALDGDNRPLGLVAGYPLGELAEHQRISLYHVMSNLPHEHVPAFVAAARALAAEVPLIEGDGYYLARMGVDTAIRGSGLSEALLKIFIEEAARTGAAAAYLHVRSDNARAIAFYRKHGFAVLDDSRYYWVMRRPVDREAAP